jgi:hypothetical protein
MELSAMLSCKNMRPLNLSETPDELLVYAAQRGDSQAFVELSKRHSAMLLRKTFRITSN